MSRETVGLAVDLIDGDDGRRSQLVSVIGRRHGRRRSEGEDLDASRPARPLAGHDELVRSSRQYLGRPVRELDLLVTDQVHFIRFRIGMDPFDLQCFLRGVVAHPAPKVSDQDPRRALVGAVRERRRADVDTRRGLLKQEQQEERS